MCVVPVSNLKSRCVKFPSNPHVLNVSKTLTFWVSSLQVTLSTRLCIVLINLNYGSYGSPVQVPPVSKFLSELNI